MTGLPDGPAPPSCRSAAGCAGVLIVWSSDVTMAVPGTLRGDTRVASRHAGKDEHVTTTSSRLESRGRIAKSWPGTHCERERASMHGATWLHAAFLTSYHLERIAAT